MPAKVSVNARPTVTARLANDVDDVNQHTAPMYAPTAGAARAARRVRVSGNERSTQVAVNSAA
jgi:hypothetical protein